MRKRVQTDVLELALASVLSESDNFSANLLIHCQNSISFLCSGKPSCCAAWVEPENPVPEIIFRPVAVSVNNCLDPRELGPQPLLQGKGRATLCWMVDSDLEI